MGFGSSEYFFFFPLAAALYFVVPRRFRLWILLGASIFFYLYSPTGYLVPIIVVTLTGYCTGILIGRVQDTRLKRMWLVSGISIIVSCLLIFKYYNFLAEFLSGVLGSTIWSFVVPQSAIGLPIGLSFYSLQVISYLIDVYRRDQTPEKNIGFFSLYTLFFIKLTAGPIERGRNLLNQFHNNSLALDPERIASGLRLLTWGLFKKMVVANKLAQFVDPVYANPMDYHGWPVIVAIYLYAFQIYADFSGYTDMAIGCARILGLDLTQNFSRPYLASSVREFWRRWHITLTSWFRDYVYFPLEAVAKPQMACNRVISRMK